MEKALFFILCLVAVLEVNSMALKGPVLTRYVPCGLGLLQFDRISGNNWRGVLNFGLYTNLYAAEIVLSFKDETTVSANKGVQGIALRRPNKHDFIVNAIQPIPDKFYFFVQLNNLNTTESDVPVVTVLSMNNVTLCNEEIKAAQTIASLNVTQQYSGKHYAHVCGRRAMDHAELVSVRTEARAGDWPWHVAIFVKDTLNSSFRYECGGNIVSRTAIVTAGHCVYKNFIKLNASQVMIVAGSNSHKDYNSSARQQLNAEKIILHPAYHPDSSTSDIAIIRVNTLVFTEFVQPLCIWGPVYNKEALFGKEATVVGFGATEFNKQSEVLRSTYTMVQNDTACLMFSPKIYTRLLNEFTLCAGYGPNSSINPRNGDSGGGLVIPTIQPDHKISWYLRGVLSKCGVSPGQKDCDPTYYVIYTDVAPHYGWIYHHAGLEYRSNVLKTRF